MSFYHVLPSNVAPNTFPNNHASSFSIPLEKPYNLSGKWEVAMMNISYTGCVNTFNHDTLSLHYKTDLKTRILKSETPVTWKVTQKKKLADMLHDIKTLLNGIISVEVNGTQCKWKMESEDMFVIMSRALTKAVKLPQDVIVPWDQSVANLTAFNPADAMPDNVSLTFVPLKYKHISIEVKAANEKLSVQDLVSRFNARVPGATLTAVGSSLVAHVKENVVVFSSELSRFMNYGQSGIYQQSPGDRFTINHFINMREAWNVSVYSLDAVKDHTTPVEHIITLPPISFQRHRDAVTYLNAHVPLVKFAIDAKDVLQFTIDEANVKLTMSDTLRDIFAFDKNTYKGAGTFKASGVFSLTRCIHYLYVYSSITDYVRIGNTEAPLLAAIPFSVNSMCEVLKEKEFKNPMYVPLRHTNVSQIDIEIHDDAGALVPFVAEAVTSLRLHYRQV